MSDERVCSVCLATKPAKEMLHEERLPFADWDWDVCVVCVDAILDGEMLAFDDGWVQPSLIAFNIPSDCAG